MRVPFCRLTDLPEYGDGKLSRLSFGSDFTDQTDIAEGHSSSLDSWSEDVIKLTFFPIAVTVILQLFFSQDFDQASTKQVADLFAEIDSYLYEGIGLEKCPELQAECRDWQAKFPHFR